MNDAPLKISDLRDERVLAVRLARPKANIIDSTIVGALGRTLVAASYNHHLKALLLCAQGPHFSFGASVEEHLPDQCAAMLGELHQLILQLVKFPAPVLVAVQGQCLGGGLELAMTGHLIFASPNAQLGQPEIKLGVFAPAASCLLPLRIGQMQAEDILLSGRSLTAAEAHRMGLVTAVAEDPEAAALDYYDEHLASLSASSLRVAVRAARIEFATRVQESLARIEALYLKDLMSTHDATEGLTSFLDKRPPVWKDR